MKDLGSAASNKCDNCDAEMVVVARYVFVENGVRQKNWNGSEYATPVFGNLERKCDRCGKHTALILDNLPPVSECESFRDDMCSKHALTERQV